MTESAWSISNNTLKSIETDIQGRHWGVFPMDDGWTEGPMDWLGGGLVSPISVGLKHAMANAYRGLTGQPRLPFDQIPEPWLQLPPEWEETPVVP